MAITSLKSINQLIFVMVKYGVLFEVRTEFLKTKQRNSTARAVVSEMENKG
jgi:hypothetical protein